MEEGDDIKQIPISEVLKHRTKDDLWVIIHQNDPGELRLVIKMYPDSELIGKYLQNLQEGEKSRYEGDLRRPYRLHARHTAHGNKTEPEILLRNKLDQFGVKYPENFEVHYVLSDAPESWEGGKGCVTKDLVEEKFPQPGQESKALLCGPPGLVKSMKETLVELGWEKPRAVRKLPDQVFAF